MDLQTHFTSRQIKLSTLLKEFILYLLAFFLIFSTSWVTKNFGEVSFDQIIYHLNFGAENFLESDQSLVDDFIKKAVVVPVLLSLTICLIHCYLKEIIAVFNQTKSLLLKVVTNRRGFALLSVNRLPLTLLVFSIGFVGYQYSFITYLKDWLSNDGNDFYTKNYIDPGTVNIHINQPKNLILIYVEALENTYENQDLFRLNLIEHIQPAAVGGVSFSGQRQLPGTGWTMAGITATQCGIPLKTALGGDHDEGKHKVLEKLKDFLPNTTCLGDILKKNNYTNVFMGGASLKYAGKGLFFSSHGYEELYGREEILAAYHHKIPTNPWGIYDDDLFAFASQRVDTLIKQNKPFNLTLLTVDTHLPKGHLSKTCKDRGVAEFKGIVKCTSEMISAFIFNLEKKGYLDNTTVIVMGDHLAMMNPEFKKLLKVKHRYIFNNYIIKNNMLKKNREDFIHFDHFPTILDSIGLQVEGGKLGLGTSGFYDGKLPNLSDRFNQYNKNIMRSSKKYQEFWQNN